MITMMMWIVDGSEKKKETARDKQEQLFLVFISLCLCIIMIYILMQTANSERHIHMLAHTRSCRAAHSKQCTRRHRFMEQANFYLINSSSFCYAIFYN